MKGRQSHRYTRQQVDFLEEIDAIIAGAERDIEAYDNGLDSAPDAIKARRRQVLSGDFRFFAYTYFPHHIRGEPSTFQDAFCTRVEKYLDIDHGVKEWWRAPRGECKSSLGTKILPVFLAVHALLDKEDIRDEIGLASTKRIFDYVLLLGAETRLPDKLLEVCKVELTVNPGLKLDFPEVCGRGPVWKIGECVTNNGVRIESYGADQAIRGQFHGSERPKWAIADDLVTEKDAKSPTIRNNRWDWVEQAIKYIGPPDGSMHYMGLGTSLNKDDPITRASREPGHLVHTFKAIETEPRAQNLWAKCGELIQNEDKHVQLEFAERGEVATLEDLPSYQYYLRRKKKMDKGAKVSWPSVRSLYDLMSSKYLNKKSFEAEMQQNPRTDVDKVFTDITFWVQLLPGWIPYGGCDPAMGTGQTSDPSGIVAGYWDPKNAVLNISEGVGKRRVMSKLYSDILTLQKRMSTMAIGFENNNAYEAMRINFMKDGLRDQTALPLIGLTNTLGAPVLIDSLETFVTAGNITISRECKQLQEQLDDWPEKTSLHHYDLLMALWCCWTVAWQRAGGIPYIATGSKRQPLAA